MKQFNVLNLGIVFLLTVFLLMGCDNATQEQPVAKGGLVGQTAPDFTLTDMQGQKVTLSQFRGKVVVLNFWATWCPPCREEMPSMERLYRNLESQGLVLLAVNIEKNGKTAVSKFLQKTPYTFPILLDDESVVQNTYGVFRFPESFIIDRNGVVIDKVIGGRNWLSGPIFKVINFLLNG